jgi:hypothetical protein
MGNRSNDKGELASLSAAQIDPSLLKAKISESLLSVKGQFEAKEAELVESVLDRVLPGFLENLERTSPERVSNLISRKAQEAAGDRLSNFQLWDIDALVEAANNSLVPEVLSA